MDGGSAACRRHRAGHLLLLSHLQGEEQGAEEERPAHTVVAFSPRFHEGETWIGTGTAPLTTSHSPGAPAPTPCPGARHGPVQTEEGVRVGEADEVEEETEAELEP